MLVSRDLTTLPTEDLLSIRAEGVRIQNTLRLLTQDMHVRLMDRDDKDPRKTSVEAFMFTSRQVSQSEDTALMIRGLLSFIEYQIKEQLVQIYSKPGIDLLELQKAITPKQLIEWVDNHMVSTQNWMEQVEAELRNRA